MDRWWTLLDSTTAVTASAITACSPAAREARLLVGAPPHRDRQRPRQQAEGGGGHRPDPYSAALPEPHEAKREQRQPGKRDRHEQERFRPIAPEPSAEPHGRSPGRRAARLFPYRSPAASPSAKARRTSLSGAVRPRRR